MCQVYIVSRVRVCIVLALKLKRLLRLGDQAAVASTFFRLRLFEFYSRLQMAWAKSGRTMLRVKIWYF
jgi:hypothetical protein